jgi:hypothetical protein
VCTVDKKLVLEDTMTKEAPISLQCDISNIARIGNMRHGEYMDVALGIDHTIQIFAYQPLGENDLMYDYEIKRLGERVTLMHRVSRYLLFNECTRLVMTYFE